MKSAIIAALVITITLARTTFADKDLDRGTVLAISSTLKSAQSTLKTFIAANNRPPTVEEMRDWQCLLLKTDSSGNTTGWLAEKPLNPLNNSTMVMNEANPRNAGGWTYKTDGKTGSIRIIIPKEHAKDVAKIIEAGLKEDDIILAK